MPHPSQHCIIHGGYLRVVEFLRFPTVLCRCGDHQSRMARWTALWAATLLYVAVHAVASEETEEAVDGTSTEEDPGGHDGLPEPHERCPITDIGRIPVSYRVYAEDVRARMKGLLQNREWTSDMNCDVLLVWMHGMGDTSKGWQGPLQMVIDKLGSRGKVCVWLPTAPKKLITFSGNVETQAWFNLVDREPEGGLDIEEEHDGHDHGEGSNAKRNYQPNGPALLNKGDAVTGAVDDVRHCARAVSDLIFHELASVFEFATVEEKSLILRAKSKGADPEEALKKYFEATQANQKKFTAKTGRVNWKGEKALRRVKRQRLLSDRIFIGGFSQGAAMAIPVAARLWKDYGVQVGGVIALGGFLVGETDISAALIQARRLEQSYKKPPASTAATAAGKKRPTLTLSNIPMLWFHGAKDDVVGLTLAEASVEKLKSFGANITLTVEPTGKHGMNDAMMRRFVDGFKGILRPPRKGIAGKKRIKAAGPLIDWDLDEHYVGVLRYVQEVEPEAAAEEAAASGDDEF